MDRQHDDTPDDNATDASPAPDEAAIRTMLEEGCLDIAAGRIVPLEPVLERMRTTVERIRHAR